MYNLEIKEEAFWEISEAYWYYEQQLNGLGERFLQRIEDYLNRIQQNPKHFAIRKNNFREAYLQNNWKFCRCLFCVFML